MSRALQNLLNLLQLEKLEEGLFRGQSEDLGLRQVFGGQVVGRRCMRLNRPCRLNAIFTLFTATFASRRQSESNYL